MGIVATARFHWEDPEREPQRVRDGRFRAVFRTAGGVWVQAPGVLPPVVDGDTLVFRVEDLYPVGAMQVDRVAITEAGGRVLREFGMQSICLCHGDVLRTTCEVKGIGIATVEEYLEIMRRT